MYSAFMVESAMLDYLTLLQTIMAPPRGNAEPNVDFLESLFDWKSESVYPKVFRSPPEYTSIKFLILLRYFRMCLTVIQCSIPRFD